MIKRTLPFTVVLFLSSFLSSFLAHAGEKPTVSQVVCGTADSVRYIGQAADEVNKEVMKIARKGELISVSSAMPVTDGSYRGTAICLTVTYSPTLEKPEPK